MKPLDYTIVCPSRKRAHNMPVLRSLLPTAMICIDEREVEDYAGLVPKDKLLVHPPMEGFELVYNWMQDAVSSEVLIEVDDDFQRILVTTGSKRKLTDPRDILTVLENAARACHDLDLTTFCFSRTPNTTVIRPAERPIVPVQAVCACFGVMGAARSRKYDTTLLGRADIDWALETLLRDRCVYADVRFYFDFGRAFGGRGGNTGVVQPAQFKRASVAIQNKWGSNVSYKGPGYQKKRASAAVSMRVSRTNNTAQR